MVAPKQTSSRRQYDEFLIGAAPDGDMLWDYYANSWNYVNAIIGPTGSGKTQASICKVLDAMCDMPPNREGIRKSRWATVRNTQGDLDRTTIPDWLAIVDEHLGVLARTPPMCHYLHFALEDGTVVQSEMWFMALDREDALTRIRGLQLTGCWFNELKELRKSIVFLMLNRTGREPPQEEMPRIPPDSDPKKASYFKPSNPKSKRYWNGGIADSNAPDDDHWLYDLIVNEQPKTWNSFIQPGGVIKDPETREWVPNPDAENITNLHADYYTDNMAGANEDFIKVNLGNQFGVVTDGAPVHPNFDDHLHTSPLAEFNPNLQTFIGVDFGRTPAAALFHDLPNGRYHVFDEFPTRHTSVPRFALELKLYIAKKYGVVIDIGGGADPAGANPTENSDESAIQQMWAEGFQVEPSPIPNNSMLRRRKALDDPLCRMVDGGPGILFNPRCKVIRAGLAGKWNFRRLRVPGEERFMSVPDKNIYSHVCEGLENGLATRGEGVIEQTPSTETKPRRPRRWNA